MKFQTIFFGAPGTGKSHEVKSLLRNYSESKIFRITIHPEYSYTDFIGQYLPVKDQNGDLSFEFKEGVFTEALKEAYNDTNEEVFLILEEVSRGNVSEIFGDIFQLLDRDEHFESKYPIRSKNISQQIAHLNNDLIILPSNFNIIGTVNINDQNVFPMDTAFKRRFEWKYVSTKPATDNNGYRLSKLNNPRIILKGRNDNIDTNWQTLYTSLNLFITDKENGLGKNEDKQLGQFFIEFNHNLIKNSYDSGPIKKNEALAQINDILRNKLLLYLWQDIQANSIFDTELSLFDSSVKNFDMLYENFGKEKVFSDAFINNFLIPNLEKYPY
ncbi:AAA family ATPase [Staphylococcus pseudintermedius]|uniref:AAA family ATPase n=1 Tax=Staphylococcus pseudintermedius TaxID=283734 RepID=UPI001E133C3B|nr:AAA family ATPase [Staphylococcus pseudintermedius]EIA5045349.1 AAA family ATPase [Staphylococcus pseudintermedius]EKN5171419.1 AAA family ATPase [Staphylococcus pseudintermedius]MCE5639777.1 AAA family ATPase [Staphylococcus pseudintermedius]MDK3807138.1 AAA family ATPase [Staphylococcus pseudintermedius]MDK4085650.1 AAA family ATPase [Staphylococcus pseudintermedius]